MLTGGGRRLGLAVLAFRQIALSKPGSNLIYNRLHGFPHRLGSGTYPVPDDASRRLDTRARSSNSGDNSFPHRLSRGTHSLSNGPSRGSHTLTSGADYRAHLIGVMARRAVAACA